MIFQIEADQRGFLMLTHPRSEVSYKVVHEDIELSMTPTKSWHAYPAVCNEYGDYEWADEPSHTNEDLYCLLETME